MKRYSSSFWQIISMCVKLSPGTLSIRGASRCHMSSAGPVTSDSTIAVGTSGKDSERRALLADVAEAAEIHGHGSREHCGALQSHRQRYRLCNCNAFRTRPKGHSTKCRSYRPSGWSRKGATDNYTEGGGFQVDLAGMPIPTRDGPMSRSVNRKRSAVSFD